MKLRFDGKQRQYHPTTGLDLVPGEHEYPDERVEQLLEAGLHKVKGSHEDAHTKKGKE